MFQNFVAFQESKTLFKLPIPSTLPAIAGLLCASKEKLTFGDCNMITHFPSSEHKSCHCSIHCYLLSLLLFSFAVCACDLLEQY